MNYDRQHLSIASALMCDEVRTEVTGKELLIGVYNQVVIVKEFPFTMRATFRVSLVLKAPNLKQCSFELIDPTGESLLAVLGADLPSSVVGEPIVCGVAIAGLTFKNAGMHTLHFGVDEKPIPTFEFLVTLPRDNQEAARVA